MIRRALCVLLVMLTACGDDTSTVDAATPPADGGSDIRTRDAGFDATTTDATEADVTIDGSSRDDAALVDAASADACVPESDREFCDRLDACGLTDDVDTCGALRSTECAPCSVEMDCEGGVTVETMAELEVFRGCTRIGGSLTVRGDEIADISALSEVRQIDSFLHLENLSLLPNATFQRLVQAGGLQVRRNDSLERVDLPRLQRLEFDGEGRGLQVESNEVLTRVRAPNLRVVRDIQIQVNIALTSVGDFPLVTEASVVDFNTNGALMLPRFPRLERLGSLNVFRSSADADIAGFEALTEADMIEIRANPLPVEISGFNALPTARRLQIDANRNLVRISGFRSFSNEPAVYCSGPMLPPAECQHLRE